MREGRKEQIFNIERVTLPMSYRKPEVAGAYTRGKWSAFDISYFPIDQKNDDICVKYAKLFCNQIRKEMHERVPDKSKDSLSIFKDKDAEQVLRLLANTLTKQEKQRIKKLVKDSYEALNVYNFFLDTILH